MHQKKILFVLASLKGGGAQRVALTLLEHLNKEHFEFSLVLLEDIYDYAIPKCVPITCLHKKRRYDFFKFIWKLARLYEQGVHVTLSFGTYANLIAILAQKFSHTKPKLLLREQNHLSSSLKHEGFWRRIQGPLIRFLYPKADRIICVSSAVAHDLTTHFRVPTEKIEIMYNPVDINHILTLAEEGVTHPWFAKKEKTVIMSMGRLTAQKNYPYLLKTFAQVVTKHPCRLVILGEEEERQALERLTKQLHIEKRLRSLCEVAS